jgi:hypothetical protein
MARFHANESFPLPVVEELRRAGRDVLTVLETGRAGQRTPDEDVLSFAVMDRRSVLTLNRRHFVRLHQERPNHSGIVVCSFDPDFPAQAQRIHAAFTALGDLAGKLVRVNRPA